MSDLRERIIAEITSAMVDYAIACEERPRRERAAYRAERALETADAILPLILKETGVSPSGGRAGGADAPEIGRLRTALEEVQTRALQAQPYYGLDAARYFEAIVQTADKALAGDQP